MVFSSPRSLNLLCIAGYLLFMSLAFDSSILDALVFYVSDQEDQIVVRSGKVKVAPVKGSNDPSLTAVQFKVEREEKVATLTRIAAIRNPGKPAEAAAEDHGADEIDHSTVLATFTAPPVDPAKACVDEDDEEGETEDSGEDHKIDPAVEAEIAQAPVKPAPIPTRLSMGLPKPLEATTAQAGKVSVVELINSLPDKAWELDLQLNRYVVHYDKDTTAVLTIRPSLQHLLENTFEDYRCKIGAGIIQDPLTGAILAMTSYDGRKAMSPSDQGFKDENWALRATFPVASLFKIVTAAAGFTKGKVSPASTVKIGRRARMEFWRAFAKSHNGVFGVVGRAVGQQDMQKFANAFGFNKPFFFDLPVTQSTAVIPANSLKMGETAAGLNKHCEISPMHVSSIVSTVLNRGKFMKPYLVDYVLHQGKVIFRRQPFQLGQPISANVAQQIFEMMKTTTTHGTGKRGFCGYSDLPELATMCGGKTGTLTGADPNYLFTWFGGFMGTTGRDLGITILVGKGSSVRAATVAGKVAYRLLAGKSTTTRPTLAAKR